jgi:acetyltransferase-like isoleucine patch superfamily enzyme
MKSFLYGIYRLLQAVIMWLPFYRVRWLWCKIVVKSIGSNVYISRNIDIRGPRRIRIGNNCVINKKVLLDGRSSNKEGGNISIGNNVDIAQDVQIWTEEHDITSTNHCLKSGSVKIEDYVWIASRATILPGITIGQGAVVASCALVTKDVEPYTVVGGVPAKKISNRNESLEYKLNYRTFFE